MPSEPRVTRSRTAGDRPPRPHPQYSLSFLTRPSVVAPVVSSPSIAPASSDSGLESDVSELSAISSAAAPAISESLGPTPVTAATPTASASTSKPTQSAKPDTHLKKKRKTSPVPATIPPLIRTNSTQKASSTSTPNNGKSKTPRVTTAGAGVPTRTQKALLIRESTASSRAGSQHVVEDDSPLPPPPPRTGMGEGSFPIPKESFLRNDNNILRQEAEFIITQAERHARELEKRKDRAERNGEIPVSGKRNRRSINYNENNNREDGDIDMSDEDDDNDDSDNYYGGRYVEGQAGPGPSTSSNARSKQRQSSSTMNFPIPNRDQSFEGQFNQLQKEQKAHILAERLIEQSRPPNFPKNAKPQIILANNNHPNGSLISNKRDKVERTYQDGLSGLNSEMESDAQGFVDNVKDNLRAILKYYFPERTPRRDAFCERIGRGLAQLGWELTDNSDAALLP
ncbi:uncharacterized protein L201_007212 [Kwoniella dendrophila CBS 6074]|uniref:Uncharacterized protein n=1 Tax=Kwoniella dendrophila CBS 6074 TaxID=1295534 RepID=A0AAX4K540_9TREE